MQENELENVLAELYRLDPGLKDFEKQLKPLLSQMSDWRPNTKFTPALAARIKEELLRRVAEASIKSEKTFTFNIMNKKIYVYAASAAVLSFAVFMLISNVYRSPISGLAEENNLLAVLPQTEKNDQVTNEPDFVRLDEGAFGSLSSVVASSLADNKMTLGAGGNAAMAVNEIAMAPTIALTSSVSQPNMTSGGDIAVTSFARVSGGGGGVSNTKMIAPWFNFKYVYKGDDLLLTEDKADVYRRVKGGSSAAQSLISLLSGLDLNGVSLNSFANLSVTSLALQEDKDKGLSINFDFLEGTINIYENWQRWRIADREACTDDACWQRFRLKITDVPTDDALISLSDNFLNKHNIDRQHYGQGIVDNVWRQDYERTEDKNSFYVPEYASVVYPLLIGEEAVRDQSGNYVGLRVSVNLLHDAVSGLNGLSPYHYEASVYELETDAKRILAVAATGGWNRSYYGGGDNNLKELELDTPFRSFVQVWRYVNDHNEEILVPALIFPVVDANTAGYYGQRFVAVPLVKDLLGELEQGQSSEGIMPMLRTVE